MIAIVDYGVGNLYSISRSLAHLGIECAVTGDAEQLMRADKIILPGVGAFKGAIERLEASGLGAVVKARAHSGVPLMGICLGMQLLFETSREYGSHAGLGLLKGAICPLSGDLSAPYKVPHIGWNALAIRRPSRITRHIRDGDCVYYVHSYYAKGCGEAVVATSEYGLTIPGIVEAGNVCGCQFHPEKSGWVGLHILRAFAEGWT